MSCEEIINENEWEDLKDHSDYEICRVYPYQIRRKYNQRILKETLRKTDGYLCVNLNHKNHFIHRLIALQWIINPDPVHLTQIVHINHIRTDNRIENLRWVSKLQNTNNIHKSSIGREIEFVQELPDEVLVINQYGKHHFEGYYFANDVFYKDTGNGNYRIVPWIKHKTHNQYLVALTDTNTIHRTITKSVFYKLYGID